NQLLPQYDAVINKQENHWATPKEFLITGYGDCEDYVIIKYFSLIKLGFDENKLFLTVVKENYYGQHHMVLSYFDSKQNYPLFLDNLSFKILNLKERKDLQAQTFINSTGVYKLQDGKLVKIAHRSLEYTELLKRIKKEG
ncbi:MAG: transglutaminase-like cysteine peptidase, partial [Campylobacterota bacterium]|nr:transglutaminase-like cysteine peptidase [Campylobacterota bacterium]